MLPHCHLSQLFISNHNSKTRISAVTMQPPGGSMGKDRSTREWATQIPSLSWQNGSCCRNRVNVGKIQKWNTPSEWTILSECPAGLLYGWDLIWLFLLSELTFLMVFSQLGDNEKSMFFPFQETQGPSLKSQALQKTVSTAPAAQCGDRQRSSGAPSHAPEMVSPAENNKAGGLPLDHATHICIHTHCNRL